MASFLKKLSKVDEKTKMAVHGWFRQQEKSLKLSNVPLMIISICILYLYEDEIFDIIGNNVEISNDRKTIKKISNTNYDDISYGKMVINSKTNYVCKWQLKFRGVMTDCLVGISESKETNENVYRLNNVNDNDGFNIYGFTNFGTKYRYLKVQKESDLHKKCYIINNNKYHKTTGFKIDDEVRIELDPFEQKLKLYVNQLHQDIDYEQVELQYCNYRLFVAMMDEGAICEIKKFEAVLKGEEE